MTGQEARRELTAAVLGVVLAGALALSAGGQPWATVTAQRRPPLPSVSADLSGADAAPLVPAAGLVLLAAAVALPAVRGAGRVVVGLFAAVAGGALAWSGLRALTGGLDGSAADLPGLAGATVTGPSADVGATWPALTLVAGAIGSITGAFVVLRGRTWPGMGRRYERSGAAVGEAGAAQAPTARFHAITDEDRALEAWKALDRGEDPTTGADDRRDP